MILPTMSWEEIARALFREMETLDVQALDKRRSFESLVKKTRLRSAFPITRTYTLRSRDRTEFYLNLTAKKKSDWNEPTACLYALFHLQHGLQSAVFVPGERILFYTDHFFTRYRERILKDDFPTARELIAVFHKRNSGIYLDEDLSKYAKEYAKYESGKSEPFAARVAEGNCFGEMLNPRVLILRTILSDEMLHDWQNESFSSLEAKRQFALSLVKDLD